MVVRRLSDKLMNNDIVKQHLRDLGTEVPLCTTVPIHEPAVSQSAVVDALLPHAITPDKPLSRIFHLDIAPLVCFIYISGDFQVWGKNSLKQEVPV